MTQNPRSESGIQTFRIQCCCARGHHSLPGLASGKLALREPDRRDTSSVQRSCLLSLGYGKSRAPLFTVINSQTRPAPTYLPTYLPKPPAPQPTYLNLPPSGARQSQVSCASFWRGLYFSRCQRPILFPRLVKTGVRLGCHGRAQRAKK